MVVNFVYVLEGKFLGIGLQSVHGSCRRLLGLLRPLLAEIALRGREELDRQRREMEEKAAAAHQVVLRNPDDDRPKPSAIELGLKREQVAKPVEFSGDRTVSTNRTVKKKKVGPNDPCPCGSGKKYKKCCKLKDEGYTNG